MFFILNQNNSRWKLHQIIHFFHLSGQQSKSIQDISPEYRTTVKAYTRHITRIQDNSQSLYKSYHHNTGQQSKPIHDISPEYRTTVKSYTSHIVEPRGFSVRCVGFGYQTQSNLVAVYTIGSMVGLRHWFYPKDKCLLWQKLYRFLTKQFIMFKCNNIFKYNNNITSLRAVIMNMRSPPMDLSVVVKL